MRSLNGNNSVLSLILLRNYVSYLIPMSIFNMGIQVFVVLSSYQYIDKKFKKTGQAKVKYPVHFIRIGHETDRSM